jgi:hypothetical protein
MTHLREPQSAARISSAFPGKRLFNLGWLGWMLLIIQYCQEALRAIPGFSLIDSSFNMRNACGGA